jgi:putative membrane protein
MTADAHGLPDATRLAVDRTRLAADRTLLAWVRTATSLISFGFTVYKFFQYLRESSPGRPGGVFGPREFALVAISLGIIALLLATVDHRRSMEGLRAQYGISNVPYSLATVLAALISCFGVLGLVAVIFHQ